jgi:hypothetical protein
MLAQWTPMRWPDGWKDPSALSLLKGAAIDYLLVGKADDLGAVRDRARQDGLHVVDPEAPPKGIAIIKGEWPGVKMVRGGAADASGGPTGIPWVDSNGWSVRRAAALDPETSVWVDAPPERNARISADSYLTAIADSAAHGGRWILSLDSQLAAGLAGQRPEALAAWKRVTAAAAFFAARKLWAGYSPVGVVGVVSDFAGKNEFFSGELLNLLGRAGQHYLVLPKWGKSPGVPNELALAPPDRAGTLPHESLRAVIYADAEPPHTVLRKQILAFVNAGGLLIAAPQWGDVPGTPVKPDENPRYSMRTLGRGRIAQANADPDDPYLWANDSVTLVSHRYDLVRFWNGGATASFYAMAPDRKRALVHLLFYSNRGPDSASVRIAGRYRAVRASTVDQPAVPNVEMEPQKDAVEVRLPQVSQYVALELEA